MKNIIYGMLALAFIFCMQESQAQVGNLLKKAAKKVEEKATEKAEDKLDEEIDKLFEDKEKDKENTTNTQETKNQDEPADVEEVEENDYSDSKNTQQTQAFFNMMGMGGDIATEDVYNFSSSIKMEMENFEKNGESGGKVLYESYINPNEKTYAMKFTSNEAEHQDSEGLMVFDYKNKAMIILSTENGEKTGMVTPINIDDSSFDEAMENESAYNEEMEKYSHLKKSGRTKNILGYSCDEYVYEDEQGKISYWFTNEVDIFNSRLFGGIERLSMFFAGQMPSGMMMQMESHDFSSNEKFMLNVKEINENQSKSISLEGYQLISIGAPPSEKE